MSCSVILKFCFYVEIDMIKKIAATADDLGARAPVLREKYCRTLFLAVKYADIEILLTINVFFLIELLLLFSRF